jgi:hypothetical protein
MFMMMMMINQPDTSTFQVYCLSFKYSLTCFGHSLAHHQELITAVAASGLPLERGGSNAVGRGRTAGPTTTNNTATTTFQQ